ncbi:hypothetical protein B0J11DRAFT_325582 [Dendryphion nanum]|uniref:Zn(2)-C6 fungal-type domain-containing protein n=1 Tax=Dendryphion nanum TaxID=256645 RepID=A0A9P9DRY0_9PLEO|nr:hypothetical protein B0J11DRAFT_325582 [Dendryphion nanum]
MTTTTRSRGLRSACDRCYQLKERCERASATCSCERCERLGQACLTVRPARRTGRQANRWEQTTSQNLSSQSTSSTQSRHLTGSWLRKSTDLSLEEKDHLTFLLGNSQTLQYSVVSPRFKDAVQESLAVKLPAAWPILKDAYMAYAGVLKSLQCGSTTDLDQDSNLRHVNAAMIALRSLAITKPEDADLCLTLGYALALSVYAAIGVGVSDICHYCLNITSPYIETAAVNPETEPQIHFLVLLETMECLVHRRKPTLRIPSPGLRSVDRHLGLSLPLLPYYHDLCFISYSLLNSTDAKPASLLRQLEDIQDHVERWQPSHPEGFVHEYSTAEVIQLLAQARVYRLGALLLIHRLQHQFGQQDSQADIWSREVMMELELARRISSRPVRFVTLPFIIAAVEVKDPTERNIVVKNVDHYVDQFTPVVQKATKTFLSRVWHERDTQECFSWLDSIHKPCVVMESIRGSLIC